VSASFGERLAEAVARRRSQVVLGLDPHPELAPGAAEAVERDCLRLIEAAGGSCVAVKPQLACFERLGLDGWAILERICAAAAEAGLLVIADGKRGDVPVTATAYAAALLREPFDAVTVNPMLGSDAMAPFLERAAAEGRGLFALVRTSNPGAADLQDLLLADGRPWHEELARLVAGWGAPLAAAGGLSSLGAVVGATVPQRMAALRRLMPDQPFLVPGVGAQGGRPEELGAAFGGRPAGALLAASRGIAGAADPARAAEDLRRLAWDTWEASAA
jgi:orotidine-5'-phosphate decarboxylase